MEQEFGMTDIDIWIEKKREGSTLFEQWFGRLSHREQGAVMVYLSLMFNLPDLPLEIVQMKEDNSI